MATSGTVSQTVYTNANFMDMAFRRAGIPHQTITAEMLAIARQDMAVMFTEWANRGYQMWTIERALVGYNYGQAAVSMPTGCIDVNFALHRTTTEATGTTSTGASSFTLDLGTSPLALTDFSIQPTAAGTYTFAVEASNDSFVTTVTITAPGSQAYTAGERKWYMADNGTSYQYYRIRETTGAAVTFTDVYFAYQPADIQLAAINEDIYATLPNKTFTSQVPVQYWFNRQITSPRLFLWPCPTNANSCMYVVYRRHIQDVGTFLQSPEVPQAWWSAVVNGLAVYLILDIKEADVQRLPIIQQMAEQSLNLALLDAGTGSFSVTVDMTAYTA